MDEVLYIMEQKMQDISNNRNLEDLMSKTYTRDDIINTRIKWKMLNFTKEEEQHVIRMVDLIVKYLNLFICICIQSNKLNNLDFFENATQKGLTQEMNNKQKEIAKKISKRIKIDNVLSISTKYTSITALIMAITNFIIYICMQDLYYKIRPTENNIFLFIMFICFGLYISMIYNSEKIIKNFKDIYINVSQNTR